MANQQTRRGLTSRIRLWTTYIVLVSSVLMIGLAIWGSQSNQGIGEAIHVQFQEQKKIQDLDRASRSILSSYQAYLGNGRPEFPDGLFHNVDGLLEGLNELQASMDKGDREEQRKADEAAYILSIWRDLRGNMEKGIQLKQNNDSKALDELSQTYVIPAADSINKRFVGLLDMQEARVSELVRQDKESDFRLSLIAAFVILLIGMAGYYLVFYIRKTVVAPVLYMNRAVSRITAGDLTELVPPTERQDEIGELQRGILAMSEHLRRRRTELETTNRELINQRDLLESQNEEIFAQQEEQRETLLKLTARERELEMISSYQEKLTGFVDLAEFLRTAIPLLLRVVGADGAAVILSNGEEGTKGNVVYTAGYPAGLWQKGPVDLYGPAARILREGKAISKLRGLSDAERSGLPFYDQALELYVPLANTEKETYGLLLLTLYGGCGMNESSLVPNKGILAQFGMVLQAQLMNDVRRKQARQLKRLNEELLRDKKLLQEQRDLISQVNETIHEGMLMLDSSGRILFANQRMNEYFGYVFQEGHTLDNFCERMSRSVCGDCGFIHSKLQAMMEGTVEQIHERITAEGADGQRHYELYINSLEGRFMEGRGFLLVFRDRTDEEKVDEMKNEFVSIVSHELRTPLSSVLGFIEILLHRSVPEDKQKRYLETIYSEANRLSDLINDFLDLQRMESGKQVYQPVPVDLPELIRHVSEQWQGKNGHTIRLETEEERMLALADADRIMQVLHNLISNAVKYSPGSELVEIHVRREDDFIRTDVKDYGLGIPEEAKARLFTKFYRVDNTDRRQIGGTGLGLAIVKEIVEAHGGKLRFESKLGMGSTFSVLLPVYHHRELSGKIVILEDDANLASMISASFEKMNVPTVCINSAEDALYSLNRSKEGPLLCIVDIQLQGVRSGWDFISELLKHPVHRDTPVIVSTVLEQPNHFFETAKGKFLRKPFTIGRLQELAGQLIADRQAAAAFVFPVQDQKRIAESLQDNGITVKQMKVNSDFIEVDIEKDSAETDG